MRRIEDIFSTNMPPLLPVQQIFALPCPPTDPIVNITDLDKKAIDLLALKHPHSLELEPFVDPLTFASLAFHHVRAISGMNNISEDYFLPLLFGHLTATWTNESELKANSFEEAQRVEKQCQTQMCSLLRRFPPTLDEIKYVGQQFLRLTEQGTKKTERMLMEFRTLHLFNFPVALISDCEQVLQVHAMNSSFENNDFKEYRIEQTSIDPQYVARIWSKLTIEELVAYCRVHAIANKQLMKSYLVGSFLTMIFAIASDNMSSNWYEKRFNTLCSLFPDLFIKVVMTTETIVNYSKLYLRQEIAQEAIFTAFLYSAGLTKDFLTENKLTWIISQIHTNSVRAAVGLAELVLTNRFLTYTFLSQHVPQDQFKAVAVLVMEIYRDPFASIVISNRKALRYLYPDLAYLGISACSHFSLYPCRPLGTAVNTKEALDNLMAVIKEISIEIEGTRLLQMDSPQIESPEERHQRAMNPYEAWEQYITKNMEPKDHAFASMMNNLLNTCRTSIIELIRNGGWNHSRKQVINEDFKEKLQLFDVVVPEEYLQPESPPFVWNFQFDNLPNF